MIFTVAYCGKIWSQNLLKQLLSLLGFVIVIGLIAAFDNSLAVWLNASDAIVGIGLGSVLFIFILRQYRNVSLALTVILVFEIVYYLLRSWIFYPSHIALSQQMTPVYETYLKRFPNLKFDANAIAWIQNITLKYQTAIWGSFQILAVFLGILLFNKTSVLKQQVKFIRFPFLIVYLLITALALSLNPITRMWGINALICMSLLYLIQGTAVLSFIWGSYFAKAKMMRTLLIMAVIINYPVLILIALIGVIDVWFDFRKLNLLEEKHESDID
ncbi:MAG: hypothetical protein E4G94_03545 [ANME-2 cluster archaeon]|nr:MAG: hypothetical protein E4G94_03545 [ANME-2 cluster archaeon]